MLGTTQGVLTHEALNHLPCLKIHPLCCEGGFLNLV